MTIATGNRNERAWNWLTVAWAVYYLAIFTVGTMPEYKQASLWGGGTLVGAWTFWMIIQQYRHLHIPREIGLLALFWGWSFLGGIMATDMAMFSRIIKLTLELVLIVLFVGTVLRHSGKVRWFYLAFIGVAVWRTLAASQMVSGGSGGLDYDLLTSQKGAISQRFFEANSVGVFAAVGIMSMLALLRETRSLWLRGLWIAGGLLSLAGVVLSASRGAFITLMAIAVLWPIFCLVGDRRLKLQAILGACAALLVAYGVFQFILANTYLGTRFGYSVHMEDESTMARISFVQIAIQLFLANPLLGVGAGQFGVASGTGYYAHNEFAELIATTGLPGFLLYYSVYWLAWRRLSWSLKILRDPQVRYQLNMARIALLTLIISGFLFRPNFQLQDTMFLIAMVVGMANWAEGAARQALWVARGMSQPEASPGPRSPWSMPGFPGVEANHLAPTPSNRFSSIP